MEFWTNDEQTGSNSNWTCSRLTGNLVPDFPVRVNQDFMFAAMKTRMIFKDSNIRASACQLCIAGWPQRVQKLALGGIGCPFEQRRIFSFIFAAE